MSDIKIATGVTFGKYARPFGGQGCLPSLYAQHMQLMPDEPGAAASRQRQAESVSKEPAKIAGKKVVTVSLGGSGRVY